MTRILPLATLALLILAATTSAQEQGTITFEDVIANQQHGDALDRTLSIPVQVGSGTVGVKIGCSNPGVNDNNCELGYQVAQAVDCSSGHLCHSAPGNADGWLLSDDAPQEGDGTDQYYFTLDQPVSGVSLYAYDFRRGDFTLRLWGSDDWTNLLDSTTIHCEDNTADLCEDDNFRLINYTTPDNLNTIHSFSVHFSLDYGLAIDTVTLTLGNPVTDFDLECGDGLTDGGFYYSPTPSVSGCDLDNNGNNCFYPAENLITEHPASLRDDLSELKADDGTDYIYLAYDMPSKYYDHELLFADAAASECAYADWEHVSSTAPGAQTLNEGCFTTQVFRLPWTDAYNATSPKCGWVRDTSGTNVKLTLDFAVRATERLNEMRNGTTITRTSEFSMPVQVEFPVQVLADATNVQVFAPVRTIAAIIGQAVTIDESTNPNTATLTLRLSTEVQKPFELHAITSESYPGDVTLASTLDGNNDAVIRKDAECTDSALDCGNEWEWTYTTQTTTEPCDFDGAYSVSFTVRCSDENDTDCPIDSATDSVTISFNVDSNDHCPKLIDSIVLSSDLHVFDAPQRVTAADDFVGDGLEDDGQTAINEGDADQWQVAYFTAPTTSTQVALDTTEFNQVWIERSDADDIILLDKDNSQGLGAVACTATAYADADDATSCGTHAGLDSTTCQLIVPDVAFPDKCGAFDFAHRLGTSADAGEHSTPWFEFDINTGVSGFNMANDAIETMTVHAVIDVTYTNTAKRTAGFALETRADFATATAPLTAGTATSSTSSTTTSSSALFGMNATVLYGAGALLALAVLAVLVVVSRRRRSSLPSTKLESTTELTSAV